MEISGSGASQAAAASTELRSAKLAKDQQEAEGQQSIQLLESSAETPKASSANPAVGGSVDTFA